MSGDRFYEKGFAGERRSASAALRNREPIADVLEEWLPSSGLVLEIASGRAKRRRLRRAVSFSRLATERR